MRRPSFYLDVRFGLLELISQLGKGEIAGVFLLACNFTDEWLPSLDSQRVSRLRIDWDRVFLKVPTVMRPCDGTSGLVRGNRRKAVLRFSGCFPAEFAAAFASGRSVLLPFSEVRGKIGNLRAQPDFCQQNRRSRKGKTAIWFADLSFSPHFRNHLPEVCGKFRNPRARCPFRAEKPQVEAFRHSSVLGMF